DTIRLVGLPFLLSIQRDSVLTIGTETPLGGINADSLRDPDRKMNLGFVATRISRTANPLPDFAPSIGHANVGGETGVSWTTTDRASFTLAANESTYFRLGVLGAKPVGTHRSQFIFRSTGRQPVTIPITMNLTTPPSPSIAVTPTVIRDTLALGDSVTNTLNIRNNGGGRLSFVVIDTALTSWLTISPIAGLVDSGTTTNVSIKVRSAGLRVDTTYAVLLVVVSNDPTRPAIPIALTLRVRRTTAVSESGTIPQTFALHQNYPNPFNPETNISFDLPKSSFVSLTIFNIIGQEVGTVVNQQLPAGAHTFQVGKEGFSLASGVYLYRLKAGEFVQTKKMLLMK
ncbi:MAG: T9SS type A sorting domain-containing protein, partial [Bacteroidota bacterium]